MKFQIAISIQRERLLRSRARCCSCGSSSAGVRGFGWLGNEGRFGITVRHRCVRLVRHWLLSGWVGWSVGWALAQQKRNNQDARESKE